MKEQIALLSLTFLVLLVVLAFTTPLGNIVGKFFLPLKVRPPKNVTTTVPAIPKPKYNLTEAHVVLKVRVGDHLIVGMKNATEMDFGTLPVGSMAIGKMYIEVTPNASVYCNITGNISKITTPSEFFVNETSLVSFYSTKLFK